jgi:hypothetical protein
MKLDGGAYRLSNTDIAIHSFSFSNSLPSPVPIHEHETPEHKRRREIRESRNPATDWLVPRRLRDLRCSSGSADILASVCLPLDPAAIHSCWCDWDLDQKDFHLSPLG